jgi:hypothetical protein
MKIACNISVGNPEGKRLLETLRRRQGDNIRILGKEGWKVWTGFIWFRIRNSRGLF